MLRCSSVVVTLFIVLTPLISEVAFSRPLSPSSQYPEVQSESDLPICYITADGRTLNLQKLCGEVSPINNNLSSRIPKEKFRRVSGSGYASDSV